MSAQGIRPAISRRHLIRTGAAAALVAASGLALRAEPGPSGVLRLAAPGRLPGPEGANGVLGRLVAPGSVFDCLAEIGPDGGLMGELAESWEPQNGGAVWAVTLRDGAEFHDGRSFQADDAVVSLRYHMAAAADRLGIVSVRKAKRLQIVITLESPDPGFPFLLSDPSLMMLPADDPVGALRHGIGTGLYRINDAQTGMRLERVAAHYKDGRAGWFEALELVGIEDAKERTRDLLAGRFDAVAAPDPGVQRKHGGKQRFIDVATPSRRHLQIRCRGDNAGPLAAALKLGLDRYAVLNEFLGGRGRVAGDTPISSEPPEQDTARARYLLAKAGVDRATLGLGPELAGFPGLEGLVRALGDFARATGLTLQAAPMPEITLDLAQAQPTSDLALRRFPLAGLSEPELFAGLLAEARVAETSDKRNEIHGDIGRILAAEAHVAVPVFADVTFSHSERLTHLGHIGALEMFDSARIAERWSYASSA